MVHQLNTLPKPRLVFLVVKLIQVSILRATHEYSTIRCSNDRRHLDLSGNSQVCGVKFDVFTRSIIWPVNRGRGESNEKDGNWRAYHQQVRDFINEEGFFGVDDGDMGNNGRLVNE